MEKKKTDWSKVEAANSNRESAGELIPAGDAGANSDVSTNSVQAPAVVQSGLNENESPEGVLQRYQANRLSRKASVSALKMRYESQLDALQHQLAKACTVEKARADVMAEEYLKELDAQHLNVLSQLGLRNKETRERALLDLTDSTVARLQEVQEKDWPPSLIEETIADILALRKRVVNEIMDSIGED